MQQRTIKIFGIPIYSESRSQIESMGTMKDPSESMLQILGNESFSGVSVNENTALNLSTVYRCTSIIANSVGMLPFGVYRKDTDGNRYPFSKHPVHFLIHDEPNQIMSSQTWRQTMQAQAVLKGNAYSIIKRNGAFRPVELELIRRPEDVTPYLYEGKLYYKITGYDKPFEAHDIFHIKGLGFDGIVGKSVLQVARESMGTALAMQQYGGTVFKTGGAKRVALMHQKPITDPGARKAITDSFVEAYGGIDKTNKVALLDGGFEVKEIGMNPEDAQFAASSAFTVNDISRYFGVNLQLLSTDKNPTYSSSEQLAIDFIKYTMTPWFTTWESEANRKLFPDYEKGNIYTKMNIQALLRGDAKARVEYYNKMFYMGAINRNEIREREDMNNVENGDKYYLMTNMSEAESLQEIHTKNNPKSNENS